VIPETSAPFSQTLNIVASISVEILPYQALFIADPFICYKSDRYQLFCEVFVSQEDKRIVHLESTDMINWLWVGDILTGDDFSFPAVYDSNSEDEVIVVPQISGTRNICAWKYCFTNRTTKLLWSVDLENETRDLIFVKNIMSDKSYLIYGGRHHGRATLLISEVQDGSGIGMSAPSLRKPVAIVKRGLVEGVMAKMMPLQRLTLRPAGSPFNIDDEGFFLPVQATRQGNYGEMIAFLQIGWDLKIKSTTYVSPKDLSPAFEKTHHISQVKTKDGRIAVFDVIRNGGGNCWELRVAKVVAE